MEEEAPPSTASLMREKAAVRLSNNKQTWEKREKCFVLLPFRAFFFLLKKSKIKQNKS
jgi:hypothetical protein